MQPGNVCGLSCPRRRDYLGAILPGLARSNPKRGNGRPVVSWSAARKASFLCCRTFKAVEFGFSVARPFFVRPG